MNIFEKYLKSTKKIEVNFLTKNGIVESFKTGFYAIEENKYILYKPKENITLEKNQKINVSIYTNSGIFAFNTNVLTSSSKLIEIKKPKNYETIQRRESLREDIEIPFILELSQDKKQKFKTKNISGSGFAFYCNEIFDKSKNYNVELDFENRIIKSQIKIVEIRRNIKTNMEKYRYGVQLLSLNKQDKDFIIQKCLLKNMRNINI